MSIITIGGVDVDFPMGAMVIPREPTESEARYVWETSELRRNVSIRMTNGSVWALSKNPVIREDGRTEFFVKAPTGPSLMHVIVPAESVDVPIWLAVGVAPAPPENPPILVIPPPYVPPVNPWPDPPVTPPVEDPEPPVEPTEPVTP